MSNRIDASVDDVKTPALNPNTNLIARQPDREQLPTRNHPMLPPRHLGNHPIWAQFGVNNPLN